ncbi:hypothetical protein O3M35_004086 [Rhynocoris fuscipes]|uniref:Uncharacterized protein n=1 Tax=Rhynocoris fuscipes TaxID=488301 RepID=A0AAW1CPM9_9HEMI
MSRDANKLIQYTDWFSDCEDNHDNSKTKTPSRQTARTPTDSEASTPDSPVVWNYNLPLVDQETKDAAKKLDLGIRAWKRKRRSQTDSSPTGIRFKKDFFLSRFRLAALSEISNNEVIDGSETSKVVESVSSENGISEQHHHQTDLFSKDVPSDKENLLSDENDLLFLEVDLNSIT